MALISKFDNQAIPSEITEVVLMDLTDCRQYIGPKHLLITNSEAGAVIIRYTYADRDEDYVVQKSIDTELENIVACNSSKHIVLEASYFVEKIKVTAILQSAPGDTGEISGKLISPPSKYTSDRG